MRKTVFALVLALVAGAAVAAPPTVAELVGKLPAGSAVVVAVDAAALRTQPAVQSWLLEHSSPWSGVDDETARFLADAGLDPMRDVDLMVVGVTAGEGAEPVALFAGRYDPSSLGAALLARGATPTTVAGFTTYRLDDATESHESRRTPLMFASNDLVIVGSESSLTAVLGGASSGAAIVNASVADGHLDLGAPFWMVVDVPEKTGSAASEIDFGSDDPEARAVEGLVRATATVRRVVMVARISDILEIHSTAVADSAENAELLRDAVKGIIAAARLQAQETYPEIVDQLRKVKVVADGAVLSVSGSIPLDLLERLAGSGGKTSASAID